MKVTLAYGTTGLTVEIDHPHVTVIEPRFMPGLPDEGEALREGLASPTGTPPLAEMVNADDTVAIVFCDITRPMPNHRVLPVLLAELDHVPREQITLINALGTHRPQTKDELVGMLGRSIVEGYRIIQSDVRHPEDFVPAATLSNGRQVRLNRHYVNASFRIVTGFVEPHFFAGFSGGPKLVLPGVASLDDIMFAHSAPLIAHPGSTWGQVDGNPVQDVIQETARQQPPQFLLEVAINKQREITGVFAGELWETHRRAVNFVRDTAMQAVPHAFDIVITSNSGYPLDQNLYQAVKGMCAAARIVKEGGSIILVSECRDGIPDHGNFSRIHGMARSPEQLLQLIQRPDFHMQDQWQVQLQAMVQQKAQVYVKSDYLTDEQIEAAHLRPCHRVEDTLATLLARYGPDATIGVLPEGPQTIPYVAAQALSG